MAKVDRDTFILENMGLVRMVVNRHKNRIYSHPSINAEDLENIGVIGLIKAYDRFDPSYGTEFSTYAVPTIEGEIRRAIRDNLDTVRFTRQSKIDYQRIVEANLLNEEPEIIAEKLEISIDDVQNALDYYNYRFPDSLDMTIYEDDGSPITLADKVGYEPDLDSNLEIELYLNQFDERTQKIIKLRLQDLTQKEIAKTIGVSQVQISRTLSRIKNKGKEHFMLKAQ